MNMEADGCIETFELNALLHRVTCCKTVVMIHHSIIQTLKDYRLEGCKCLSLPSVVDQYNYASVVFTESGAVNGTKKRDV